MNNARRKEIAQVVEELQALAERASELKDRVEELQTEEQDYYDNMPESFQQGEKGEEADARAQALQSACDDLDAFDVDAIVGYLEEASA